MYMYLSDRIRRMFLSGACPQNISPKKPLSLKDQRFLQKNVADKNLSRILVKQQKLLYEKHKGILLEAEKKTLYNLTPLAFPEKTKNKEGIYYLSNSEGLFLQNIKVQKEKQGGLFNTENQKNLTNKAEKNPLLLEKSGILNIGKGIYQAKQKTQATLPHSSLDTFFVHNGSLAQAKPLFVNHESSYKNCRYLYDHESLKTSIVPQIFKNQKPTSRAKTLLHERKKIALLYGQLAKKDIINISKKALSIPGFFEDNMFTLLESRVDVCVFRAGFSKTIAGARQLIRNGSVLVNGQKIYSCKRKAKPGDYFSFTHKETLLKPYQSNTLELYRLCLSSNFLRDWVSLNKMKLLWQFTFRKGNSLTGIKDKKNKTFSAVPEWLLLLFFAVPFTKKDYKPSFCSSLYWGFFLYKLKNKAPFACFFEQKKQAKGCWALPPAMPSNAYKVKQNSKSIISDVSCEKQSQPVGFVLQSNRVVLHAKKEHGMATKERLLALHCDNLLCNISPFNKKKKSIFLNLYTQLLLKKQQKNAKMRLCNRDSGSPKETLKGQPHNQHLFFRRKIPSSLLWAIWGQKPLHLEISHKTGGFIYLYKPQKLISPVCLDFKP